MKFLVALLSFLPLYTFANAVDLEKRCQQAGGQIIKSDTEMSTRVGFIKGLAHDLCFIEKDNRSMMIGLKTLGSTRPSIAATYLLKGIEMDKLPKGTLPNPATDVCRNLGGASIGFYTSGGMTNKYGQSGMCVFGDGSMVSPWSIIYISMDDGYMDLRKHIASQVLPLNLPYLKS